MTARRTAHWIVALEQARAQLELALGDDADWRALGQAASRGSRAAHERALSGNPVYRAWDLLGRVVAELDAEQALLGEPEAAVPPSGDADGEGRSPQPQTATGTARRRVSLREVLESIRSDAALDSEPPAPAVDPGPTPPAAAPRMAPADPEEAAVSFVVRGPAQPTEPPQADEGNPPGPKEAAGPKAADRTGDASEVADTEAEVVIVPRSG